MPLPQLLCNGWSYHVSQVLEAQQGSAESAVFDLMFNGLWLDLLDMLLLQLSSLSWNPSLHLLVAVQRGCLRRGLSVGRTKDGEVRAASF